MERRKGGKEEGTKGGKDERRNGGKQERRKRRNLSNLTRHQSRKICPPIGRTTTYDRQYEFRPTVTATSRI